MKLKIISDRYKNYLQKIEKEPSESVSVYVFYGDKENEGVEQLIYQTGNVYDSNFGEYDLINICKDLTKKGWSNIVIERYKVCYKRMRTCPVMANKSICVNKYKLID